MPDPSTAAIGSLMANPNSKGWFTASWRKVPESYARNVSQLVPDPSTTAIGSACLNLGAHLTLPVGEPISHGGKALGW